MKREEWQKIVDRGPFVLPTYEPSRSEGELYSMDPETGELDLDDVVGYMPNVYYDKRYADYYYYSFTAIIPDGEEIGCYSRGVFDEDDGTFDDAYAYFEIEGSPLRFMTEKDFIANNYVYNSPDFEEVAE